MINKYRDVITIPLHQDELLIIACDSCGAIGMKNEDQVKVSPFITGKYTARVSLMEVISLGAKIVGMSVSICNEMEPTGRAILDGVYNELEECNIQIPVTVSTEKNMATTMTALGVTAVGVGNIKNLRMNKVSEGNLVYIVGVPKVGNEVVEDRGEIVNSAMLLQILKDHDIKEIIPVGSLGIKRELDKFLKANQLNIACAGDLPIDLYKSAGPCTTAIIISSTSLKINGKIPQYLLGELY